MKRGLILTGGSASADVELAVRAEAAGFDAVFSIEFFIAVSCFLNTKFDVFLIVVVTH